MVFYAHTKEGVQENEWHTLKNHLEESAKLAKKFAEKFSCELFGKVLGLCHDLGKYSQEFQQYLRNQEGKGPDHSTAGAKVLIEKYNKIGGKLLAYPVMGHHAGLPNGNDETNSNLKKRLEKNIPNYQEWSNEIKLPEISEEVFKKKFCALKREDNEKTAFAISFFIRMLFSCLVDADRLNTEKFGDINRAEQRENYPSLKELNEKLEEYLKTFKTDSEINIIRNEVLEKCKSAAKNSTGFYQLTVPTGGGKTLSSMAFALNHAIKNNLDRVIYVIPYTSIIEQNANVFRKAFKDLSCAVVEHHSNFDESLLSNRKEDEIQAWELSVENWDAPVIVTTTVQFFESLFSCKPSSCRKLHNIAKSVVILDEAQMLPIDFLYPCLRVLEELTHYYKTTVVLCTATQPALNIRNNFKGIEIKQENEIVGTTKEVTTLYNNLKRVNINLIKEKLSIDALADHLSIHSKVLCIVNSRGRARKLFELLPQNKKESLYHLSANMCPEHRAKKLEEIKERLKENKDCILISTQVIEAGVDIDFPIVYREIAGLDSIVQAAGRCNREGKLEEKGQVFLFEPEDGVPTIFEAYADSTREVIYENLDLLSLDAIRKYFELIFWRKGEELDKTRILTKISEDATNIYFPFREISETFKIIDSYSIPILIPYSEGKDLICNLQDTIEKYKPLDRKLLRQLQRYTVNIYPNAFIEHFGRSINYLIPHQERFAVLQNFSIYDDEVGIKLEDPYFIKQDQLII